MRLRVTKRADAQIDQAASWWEQNRPYAPGAVDEELTEAFALLAAQPGIGAPALNARTRGVKRILLARIHTGCITGFVATRSQFLRCGTPVAAQVLLCRTMTPNYAFEPT